MAGISDFGMTAAGQRVQAITLRNGALTACILTYGAILQGLRLEGVGHGLTLGSESLADYEGAMRFHGALIAPVANRLRDGRAPIDGGEHQIVSTDGHPHALHSGPAGAHLKNWTLEETGPASVTLALRLPDGEGGFPGNRDLGAVFSLPGGDRLRMEVTARTDRPTLFNAANHSYWNLDGSANWQGHRLRIAAGHYLPADADVLPTGEIAPVAGSDFDFRAGRVAGPENPALDHNFCLSNAREALRPVLDLTGASGVRMELSTTEPGLQIYDGRGAARPGHATGEGLAIEAQGWPDAPNHQRFPSIALNPGETYRQITEWRFSTG